MLFTTKGKQHIICFIYSAFRYSPESKAMLKETGIIVQLTAEFAEVATALKTTCGSCSAKDTCGTSALAEVWNDKQNIIRVSRHEVGEAAIGQKVELSVDETGVVGSAFLVYILPLITFLVGYFVGERVFGVSASLPWKAIFSGILFASASLYSVNRYLRSEHCAIKPIIRVSKIFPADIPIKVIKLD